MGIPYVMNTAAAIMHCAATRQAMPKRPSKGNNSSRATRSNGNNMSLAVAATADYHICRSTHPQDVLVSGLKGDAHRKALRDTYPVERFLDIRKAARQADHFRRYDSPANIFNASLDNGIRASQHIHRSAGSRLDIRQLGFAEKSGGVPAIGIYQGKEGLMRSGVLTFRNRQPYHQTMLRRKHFGIGERLAGNSQSTSACLHHGLLRLNGADQMLCRLRLRQCLIQTDPGVPLERNGVIQLLFRDIAFGGKRL